MAKKHKRTIRGKRSPYQEVEMEFYEIRGHSGLFFLGGSLHNAVGHPLDPCLDSGWARLVGALDPLLPRLFCPLQDPGWVAEASGLVLSTLQQALTGWFLTGFENRHVPRIDPRCLGHSKKIQFREYSGFGPWEGKRVSEQNHGITLSKT